MTEEMILEVDINNNPLGFRPRKDFHDLDIIHRASILFLFNNKNEILLQKRDKSKEWNPGLYDFSVSGTMKDEEPLDCIRRETEEELGLNINKNHFIFLFTTSPTEKQDKSYQYLFKARTGSKLEEIKFNKEEIESIKWISVEDLKKELENNPKLYTPQLKFVFNKYLGKN